MAKNHNTSCDGCGTILYGMDRGAFVKKDNVFVNGQMGENLVDPQTAYQETVYFTPTPNERLCFCGGERFWDCFATYLDTRRTLWKNNKLRKLYEQGGRDANDRLAGSF